MAATKEVKSLQTTNKNNDLIPYTLLAIAKDYRYIQQCQLLLQCILRKRNDESNDDTTTTITRNNNNLSWWTAALLYVTIIGIKKTNRRLQITTLGMEGVGLSHYYDSMQRRRRNDHNTLFSRTNYYYCWFVVVGWGIVLRQYYQRVRRHHHDEEDQQRQDHNYERQLRGFARLSFHRQQRRAMIQRASSSSSASSSDINVTDNTTTTSNFNTSTSLVIVREEEEIASSTTRAVMMERIRQGVKRLFQIAVEAMSCTADNPHSLSNGSSSTTVMSIGRWIARLQLARFCITGTYPTLWHYLFNTSRLERDGSSSSRRRLVHPLPTTHGWIGRLIVIQASAIVIQSLVRSFVISYGPSSRRRRETDQQDNDNEEEDASTSSSSSAAILSSSHGSSSTTDDNNNNQIPTPAQLCVICRMSRLHSAVPSTCGHIVCWRCLYQWVSTVRPECPLCRAACRPQDVLALYHYAPSSSSSSSVTE